MRDATTGRTTPARGFTLVELLIVLIIIGILLAFILVAAQDGVRRAEEKATLGLITKLETGLSERIEAILSRRADVYQGHIDLALIWNPTSGAIYSTTGPFGGSLGNQRSQVIAMYDLYRAELPDVFFIQANNANYPLNFAGIDYPIGSGNYNVPIGSSIVPTAPLPGGIVTYGTSIGVYGATFQAAGGLTKNLGYLPAGYDGTDNNQNGLIDELAEGTGGDPTVTAKVQANLLSHKHITARSEMLYALLVEGIGPLGSVFNRDDFTNREVADTDGDGMPEFIDAWGNPLQFYRWPIYFNSENNTGSGSSGGTASYIQKGSDPYTGFGEPRQVASLDPSQTLMSPGWFDPRSNSPVSPSPIAGVAAPNGATTLTSKSAIAFMTYFTSLLDPHFASGTSNGQLWDRSGFYPRRAFYCRPLILSAGPDGALGVASLDPNYNITNYGFAGTLPSYQSAQALILIENQAAPFDPTARAGPFFEHLSTGGPTALTQSLLSAGADDVSNQGLASPGGGVR